MAGGASTLLLAVSWTETALGICFYTLRFVSNWKFTERFRWDFFICTLAVATQLTAQAFLQASVDQGMGMHAEDLVPSSNHNIVTALKWGWVYQLLAIMSSTIGKLAILAVLIHVRGRHLSTPWFLYVLGVLISCVNIAVLGTIMGQCKPAAKLWDDSLEGTCDPGRQINQDYSFFQASFNTACDAALATYPILVIRNLQIKFRVKVVLCVLMGLGWVAAVCSAVKCYQLEALTKTDDITYDLHQLLIWASTEAWIVIIVGCIPPSRPIMERALQLVGLSSSRNKSHRGNNTGPYSGSRTPAKQQLSRSSAGGNLSSHMVGNRGLNHRDDQTWIELSSTHNNSEEHVLESRKNVLVTTDISMRYEPA